MKRRNAECGKLRRPIKRKITDGIYASACLYLKISVLWAFILLADHNLGFRFEFLWPFWVFLRGIYDSFKHQGLLFSIFFVCIVLASNMICYFLIPVDWLFFAASSFVGVQFVWQPDKPFIQIYFPTFVLGFIFIAVECGATVFKGIKPVPLHFELCQPFALHCIGCPAAMSGFRFKSFIFKIIKELNHRNIVKSNEVNFRFVQRALPLELQLEDVFETINLDKIKGNCILGDGVSNGVFHSTSSQVHSSKNNHRKSLDKGERDRIGSDTDDKSSKLYLHSNGSINMKCFDVQIVEKNGAIHEFEENEIEKYKIIKGFNHLRNNNKWNNSQAKESIMKNRKNNREQNNTESSNSSNSHRDEYFIRLEADIKKLRSELQTNRLTEQDLRSQIHILLNCERSNKIELSQLQSDNEELKSKLQKLVSAQQTDKQALSQLEKRIAEERRLRTSYEQQLATAERKAKKAEESATARVDAMATAVSKVECTESCKVRRKDLEAENKQLRKEIKAKEEKCNAAEREVQNLRQYKDKQNPEYLSLVTTLSAVKDKNAHLENSLSAETRIKLDLFSALGEAKRQLSIRENLIKAKEKEMEELKAKLAQVLAVMPTDSFGPPPQHSSIISKLVLPDSHNSSTSAASNLDPNASVYTPKTNCHISSTAEA